MTPDSSAEPWYSLTVPSDLRALSVVRRMVEAVCQVGGVPSRECGETVQAVHEACSNIVRHAHAGQRDLPLTVACRVTAGALEVLLRDRGQAFDLNAVRELDPAEARPGGRGVFLIRRLVDEATCAPCSGGGNELLLIKRFSTQADASPRSEAQARS